MPKELANPSREERAQLSSASCVLVGAGPGRFFRLAEKGNMLVGNMRLSAGSPGRARAQH